MPTIDVNGYQFNVAPGEETMYPGATVVDSGVMQQPAPAQAPAQGNPYAPAGAPAQPVAPEEALGVRDYEAPVYQAPVAGGNVRTTSSVKVEDAQPDDPLYAAYRAQSLEQKQRINDMQADVAMQQNDEKTARLNKQAADQALQAQQAEGELARRQAEVDRSMRELDATITQQRQQWMRGQSPNALFDGSFGAGNALAVIGVTLAGMGGEQYQQNAMQMVQQGLDRAQRQQEFVTNSMFNQLKNKYGDADMARESLKAMQLNYMSTMAELYASQNANPQMMVNYLKLQNQLNDEYMATEDKIRRLAIGKVTETQNYRYQQGSAGGWRAPTEKEKQERIKTDKLRIDALGKADEIMRRDQAAGNMPPEAKAERIPLAEANKATTALVTWENMLVELGATRNPDGTIDTSPLKEGGVTGVGFGVRAVPSALQSEETVRKNNMIEQAAAKAGEALSGIRPGHGAVKDAMARMRGGVFAREGQQLDALINTYDALRKNQAALNANLSPATRAYQQRIVAESRQAVGMQASDEGLGGEEIYK